MLERKLRVLVVTSLWPTDSGHAGRQVELLVSELGDHAGVQVDVLHLEGTNDMKYIRWMARVRRAVSNSRPDVLLFVYGPSLLAGLLVRSVPRVVYLLGSDVNNVVRGRLVALAAGRGTRPVFVSESLRKGWAGRDGVVIPNGVDRRVFKPGDQLAARGRLGLPADARVVMFGGLLHVPTKNYPLFREALDLIRVVEPGAVELTLSGASPPSAVADHLVASDVLLFTSNRGTEGSPTIVKEALACATPVVTVDVGDVSVWVTPDRGTVTRWDDSTSMAQQLADAAVMWFDRLRPELPVQGFPFDANVATRRLLDVLDDAVLR